MRSPSISWARKVPFEEQLSIFLQSRWPIPVALVYVRAAWLPRRSEYRSLLVIQCSNKCELILPSLTRVHSLLLNDGCKINDVTDMHISLFAKRVGYINCGFYGYQITFLSYAPFYLDADADADAKPGDRPYLPGSLAGPNSLLISSSCAVPLFHLPFFICFLPCIE